MAYGVRHESGDRSVMSQREKLYRKADRKGDSDEGTESI